MRTPIIAASSPPVDAGWNWNAIAAAAAVLGVAFVYAQVRDIRRTRHAELIAQLSERWDAEDVLASAKLMRLYGAANLVELVRVMWDPEYDHETDDEYESNIDDWYELSIYPNLMETFGVLYDTRLLPLEVIHKMWSLGILDAWDIWRDATLLQRKLTGSEEGWLYFERLAVALRERAVTGDPRSPAELMWDDATRRWTDRRHGAT